MKSFAISTLPVSTDFDSSPNENSPAGSRTNGDVRETLTVMLPSVTKTAPSTGAIETVYL